MLVLEGAQAGLSWTTILRKRERYRQVFDRFDPAASRPLRRREGGRAARRRGHRAQPAEDRRGHRERARVPGRAAGVRQLRRLPLGVRSAARRASTGGRRWRRCPRGRRSRTRSARLCGSEGSVSSARRSATPSCRRSGWSTTTSRLLPPPQCLASPSRRRASRLLRRPSPRARRQVDGEAAEPVAALVVLAGHGAQPGIAVARPPRHAAAGARASPAGRPAAIPSSIQARLRLRPSRCASFGSLGSVTTAGSSQAARPVARNVAAGTPSASARTRRAAARGASGRPRRGTGERKSSPGRLVRQAGSSRPAGRSRAIARRRAGRRIARRRQPRAQSRIRPNAKAVWSCSPIRIGFDSLGSQSFRRAAAASLERLERRRPSSLRLRVVPLRAARRRAAAARRDRRAARSWRGPAP